MKKEAMIKVLRYKAEHIKTKIRPEFFAEVVDMLEQEPCEDCISRADAIRVASGYCHPANISKELAKLPPVQPKPKVGHWINNQNGTISCSYCQTWFNKDDRYFYMRHCPYCNVKMVEPQEESEDKG